MRIRAVLSYVAVIVALTGTFSVGPAQAATTLEKITRCGQTITRNAYLSKDLTCTQGFPLIDAESLREQTGDPDAQVAFTVDLRGHRITGQGPTSASTAFEVADYGNWPALTVKNGRVDRWGTAMSAEEANLTVSNVRIDHNGTGVNCSESAACLVNNSRIDSNTLGTASFGGVTLSQVVVSGNRIGSSARYLGSITASHSAYLNNSVGISIPEALSDGGFADVRSSVFSRNGAGVRAETPTDFSNAVIITLVNNRFSANGDGVYVTFHPENGDAVTLGGNRAENNTRYGFFAKPGVTDNGGNKASGNGKPCVGVVCSAP